MSSFDPGAGRYSQAAVRDLRPLSIGEILDRAFSICFRHFIAFASLVAVIVGPQLLFYYLGARDMLSATTDMLGEATSTGAPPVPMDPNKMLALYANGAPYFLILAVLAVLVVPLSNAAVVSGVSRAYLGLPVRFAQCYADAFPRWRALILLMLLWLAAVMLASITFVLAFAILGAALAFMGSLLGTVGLVVAIVIGVAVGAGCLLLAFELYLAAAYSFVAAVLEGVGAGFAFRSGFQRVFGEGQFWRSAGIAAALFGIIIGFELIGATIGMAAIAIAHSYALEFVMNGLIGAFTYPFLFAVVAVSYYDVRIRREGFDLQMLAAQLGATPPASAQ
jgi:hypothetical protein